MTSPEYQAPTWVNEDDPDFIEGVSPALGAGYLNQLSGAVEDHGQRLGAITPVVTNLQNTALDQAAGDNRYILQSNANGFAPAEATATALAGKAATSANLSDLASVTTARTNLGLAALAATGKLADAIDVTATGAAIDGPLVVDQVNAGVPTWKVGPNPAGLFPPLKYRPAARVSRIPGVLDNRLSNNVTAQSQDPIATRWNPTAGAYVQAAVWSNHVRHVIVGIRTLPSETWTTVDLYSTTGNGYSGYFRNRAVPFDEHNGLTVMIDGDGYLHVAGNMHGDFLTYARSTAPWSVTEWEAPGMIGSGNDATTPMRADEKLVSYPRFMAAANGTDLLFLYRNGASGNGDCYLNRYNTATKTWTRVCTLLQGSTATPTAESAYVNHVAYRGGRLGLSWTWRPNGGGTVDTHDLAYIYSDDDGATWKTAAGAAQTVPITPSSSPTPILAGTQNGSLDVGHGMDLDLNRRPHIVMKALTSGVTASGHWQLKHLWWDGSAWQQEYITDWVDEYKSQNDRAQLFIPDNGRVYVLVSWFHDNWRDAVRLIDCTPGQEHTTFRVADLPLRTSPVLFDTWALRESNQLHMWMSPSSDYVPSSVDENWCDDNWLQQWAVVVSVDCDQLEQIQSQRAHRPRVRTVTSGGLPQATAISTLPGTPAVVGPGGVPAGAQVANAASLITAPEVRGKLVVARLSVTAIVAAAGQVGGIQLCQTEDGATSYVLGTLPFFSASTLTKVTPWIPLTLGPGKAGPTGDGRLTLFGWAQSLTHTVTVTATGGTMIFKYGQKSTAALAYNAPLATVQAALEALTSVSGTGSASGNVTVTGTPGTSYVVAFASSVAVPGSALTLDVTALTGGGATVANAGGTLTLRGCVSEYGVIEV